jgi:hypothetical protein
VILLFSAPGDLRNASARISEKLDEVSADFGQILNVVLSTGLADCWEDLLELFQCWNSSKLGTCILGWRTVGRSIGQPDSPGSARDEPHI